MKLPVLLSLLAAGVLVSSCVFHKQKSSQAVSAAPMIITPDNALTGRVISYDDAGRFVVLSFANGRMPAMGQTLFLYRGGLKSGEVKISGPQREDNVVADLVRGNAQPGDDVREQ